jgi:protein gp37
MADVFEDRPELVAHRERLFDLIEATPHLIWQLLTKRPQNIHPMTQYRWFHGFPFNVWVGTTVEDQQRAYERIPILAKFQELASLSEALSMEHATSFRAMSQFVSLWNDGDRDEAVEVLKGAGFRITA